VSTTVYAQWRVTNHERSPMTRVLVVRRWSLFSEALALLCSILGFEIVVDGPPVKPKFLHSSTKVISLSLDAVDGGSQLSRVVRGNVKNARKAINEVRLRKALSELGWMGWSEAYLRNSVVADALAQFARTSIPIERVLMFVSARFGLEARVWVIPESPVESLLIRKSYPHIQVVLVPGMFAIGATTRYVARMATKVFSSSSSAEPGKSDKQKHHLPREASTAFLAHRGLSYGNLFSWTALIELFGDQFVGKPVLLAYDDTRVPDLYPRLRIPEGIGIARLVNVVTVSCFLVARGINPAVAILVSRSQQGSIQMSEWVKEVLPQLKFVLVAYDNLVPPRILIGLRLAGVKTVAFQERPNSAHMETFPILSDVTICAGPEHGRATRCSPLWAGGTVLELGMWRTNWLQKKAFRKPVKSVLILPYHAAVTRDESQRDLATSWVAFSSFADEICHLASRLPQVDFTVRFKALPSLDLQVMRRFIGQVEHLPNLALDEDYSEEFRTYTLMNRSDVIIGKYSSVLEEAIAVGKRVLIHDYSPNGSGMSRPTAPHLPRDLWALNPSELALGTDELIYSAKGRVIDHLEQSRRKYVFFQKESLAGLLDGTSMTGDQ